MSSSRKLVIMHLLQSINNDEIKLDKIKSNLRLTDELVEKIIVDLENEKLIEKKGGVLNISFIQRIGLSRAALEVGADFESVSRILSWLEFEELSALLFEENGFEVFRRFRFTVESKRREIDLLAIRNPYIICAECKHWKKGIGNTIARGIIENHIEKVKIFSNNISQLIKRLSIEDLKKVIIIPMAVTLSPTPMTIYRIVPSVSILSLTSFLNEFDGQLDSLTSYKIILPVSKMKFKQKKLREEY
jgi:Holliday junction resolvase